MPSTPRITTFLRDIPGGNGINAATALVKRHADDASVATGATAGSGEEAGRVTFTRAQIGYPGPVYIDLTGAGQRKMDSGMVVTQSGAIWLDDLPNALETFGCGVVRGLDIFSPSGLNLSINPGFGIFKDGLPFVMEAAVAVGTVGPAHPTLPRIDRIVLRVSRRGQGDEGLFQFVVIPGTAASTPTAPNITQTAALWDFSLAQIRLEAAATSIAPSKITQEAFSASLGQYPISQLPSGLVKGDLLYVDANGRLARLASGASDTVLTVDASSDLPTYAALTSRGRRGVFSVVDGNAAAQTPDTTNTATSVLALQTSLHVPAGTWTITVNGGIALRRDALGQSYGAIEVESDEAGGYTLNIDDSWTQIGLARTVTSFPGNQDINVRVRFRSVASGRTYARNPWQRIDLERTA